MNSTQIIITVCVLAAIALLSMWYATSTAYDLDKEKPLDIPKFQPRKVTVVKSSEETPKRKKKRYYNSKKKKPAVAENAQVEKRPVGRPKKSN